MDEIASLTDSNTLELNVSASKSIDCCDDIFDAIQLTFSVNVSKLSNITKIIRIRNFLWKFEIQEDNRGLFFQLLMQDKLKKNSAIFAKCKITIVSETKQKSHIVKPDPFFYTHNKQCNYSTTKLCPILTWDEFYSPHNGFIIDGSCTFKVKIKVSQIQHFLKSKCITFESIEKCCDNVDSGKFCFTINKTLLDKSIGICSPEFIIHNVPWQIVIMNVKANEEKDILFCLHSSYSTGSCCLSVISKLLPFDSKIEPITYVGTKTSEMPFFYGLLNILKKDLVDTDKKFIKNDSFQFEMQLKIEQAKDFPKPLKFKFECPICMNDMLGGRSILSTLCGHIFCKPCITTALRNNPICPVCRTDSQISSLHPIFLPSK